MSQLLAPARPPLSLSPSSSSSRPHTHADTAAAPTTSSAHGDTQVTALIIDATLIKRVKADAARGFTNGRVFNSSLHFF